MSRSAAVENAHHGLSLTSTAAAGSDRRRCDIVELHAAELNKTACQSPAADRVEEVDAAAVAQSAVYQFVIPSASILCQCQAKSGAMAR